MNTSFNVGDKTVYPGRGVAEITGVERREISGATLEFYVLRVLENNVTIMVPKSNAASVGLRRLVDDDEVDAVYRVLRDHGGKISMATWNRRHREYQEKINTGSLVEIASVLRDLSLLRTRCGKDLSFGEKKMLEQARALLVQELALARGKDEAAVTVELERLFEAAPTPES